ncbi:unnamed protein product [Closterium sp. Naga37s-1]|nr:unnamed protein product [Closterium sp. Naga37s-1]
MTNNETNKDRYVGTEVRLAGVAYDAFSLGKGPLSAADIATIARWQIGKGKSLKYDANGVYFVLTSNIVEVDGFCSNFCGWHTKAAHYLGPFNLGFAGDHGSCPDPCMPEPASPNGNTAMDATVSTLANKLVNIITNPDTETGWMMGDGSEVSDNCDKNYGNDTIEVKYARNSDGFQYRYNLIGNKGMKFLISKAWDRIENTCMLQNDLPEDSTPCPNIPRWIRPRLCDIFNRCC